MVFCSCAQQAPIPESATLAEIYQIPGVSERAPTAVPAKAAVREPRRLFRPLLPNPKELDFAKVLAVQRKYRFQKMEDLLQKLADRSGRPDSYPEFFNQYTLAVLSQSLHSEADRTHPRAIVYGETANFIMTYFDKPGAVAQDKLEMSQFNHQTGKFEFYELDFKDGDPLVQTPEPLAGGPRDAHHPEGLCLTCHQGGRPLWKPYPLWPGMVAGDDDQPYDDYYFQPKVATSRLRANPQWLDRYYVRSRMFPEMISWDAAPLTVDAYSNFESSKRYSVLGVRDTRGCGGGVLEGRTLRNTCLSLKLVQLNLERMVRELERTRLSRAEIVEGLYLLKFIRMKDPSNPRGAPVGGAVLADLQERFDAKYGSGWREHRQSFGAYLRGEIGSLAYEHGFRVGEVQRIRERKGGPELSDYIRDQLSKRKFPWNDPSPEAHARWLDAITDFNRTGFESREVVQFYLFLQKTHPELKVENWSMLLEPGLFVFSGGYREQQGTYVEALAEVLIDQWVREADDPSAERAKLHKLFLDRETSFEATSEYLPLLH